MCIQHERIQIFYTLPSSSIPAFSIFFNMDLAYKLSQNQGGLDRQCAMEDREDCFGRATVALTRAIRQTYIVSPIDMAGMIGMAQTLAVYHYGYYTLKNRLVQCHEPKRAPSDAEAVLEWGLNTPFKSQDKPPLAITMVVTLNGARSLRRYRLVLAQKAKLRLTQEVTAALASHSRDHRLTVSSFSRVLLIVSTCMAMQGMDTDLHYGFVLPTMALRSLFTG